MTAPPFRLPDYGGAWTGAVVPGLTAAEPPSWFPAELAGARAVVLLVLDGLGWDMVGRHGDALPALRTMAGCPITTAAPTTTAAALTSITTGLPPAEHGVVGFRMRVGGEVLNVLQWRTAAGEAGPDPRAVQPHEGFGGRAVPIITRASFADSGFTAAHLRTGRFVGWVDTRELVDQTAAAVARGERLVYAYYDGIDKVAHEFGLRDAKLPAELRRADHLVEDLLAALPADAALAVTADHGHVHVGPEGMRALDAVRGLVGAYSGEGRFRSLHAAPGASRRLHDTAREAFGDEAWVLTRDEVWAAGILGPSRPSAEVAGRIGDVVLIARADVAYVAPDLPREAHLVGCHGSLTSDELLVPLLAARGG